MQLSITPHKIENKILRYINKTNNKNMTKELKPDEIDYVIYHYPCSDGMASAYAAWRYHQLTNPEKEIKYLGAHIGAEPPNDIDGKNLLICDYSYKKDALLRVINRCNKTLIIDHHKTAQENLKDIDDKYKIFDMEHSGCVLTWMYFFPNIEPPLFLRYVEDTDIWKKTMPKTQEFSAWFHNLPFNFEMYDKCRDEKYVMEKIDNIGKTILETNEKYVIQSIDKGVVKFVRIKGKYYQMVSVNSPLLVSDIGNKLCEKFPYADFAAVYYINDYQDATKFSLRSTNTQCDVSEIADSFGGGGHRNASGCEIPFITNTLEGNVIGNIYNECKNIEIIDCIVEDEIYHLAIFEQIYNKLKIGRYLLQKRYGETQTCQEFYKLKNGSLPDKCDVAIIWHYNTKQDKTEFQFVFESGEEKEILDKKIILMKHFGLEKETDTKIYDGLIKNIENFNL